MTFFFFPFFFYFVIIESKLSRKLIHIGTGPLFMACWIFYGYHNHTILNNNNNSGGSGVLDDNEYARYFASSVPLVFAIKFGLVGLGVLIDEATVKSMSRSGAASELLKGPVIYGLIFVFSTIYWWRYSPVGVVSLIILCVGDGFAEVIGRRFGKKKLWKGHEKSWVGSSFFLASSFLASWFFLDWFSSLGWLYFDFTQKWFNLLTICAAAAVTEAITPFDMDNLTVFLVVGFLGSYLL